MPSIAEAIAQLESGGGRDIASQPSRMVNPLYGQYSGFVNQYGSGEAGINNFAAQTLAANPNATFGDLYAGYVRGTGIPGQYSLSDLQAVNSGGQQGAQGAFTNLMNNSPIPANTPLSQLISGSGTTLADGPPSQGQGFNFTNADVSPATDTQFPPSSSFDQRFTGQTDISNNANQLLFDPSMNAGSTTSGFNGSGILSSNLQGQGTASVAQAAAAPDASQTASQAASSAGTGSSGTISGTGSGVQVQIGPQPGLTSLVQSAVQSAESAFGQGMQKVLSSALSSITNYFGITGNLFVRFGLILLGVVIVAVALNKLMGGPNLKDVAAAAASAAKAA